MNSAIEVKGLAEVKAALSQLTPKLAERLTRIALRQGANYMAKQIRAAAPIKTGRLRKAVKVRTSKINRLQKNGRVGVFVSVYPGKSRKDPKGAWYGKFVENGYNRGSQQVTGRQAVTLGVITKKQLDQKKALVASRRRFGRVKQGIRYRYGGQAVAGQHFVRDTFNARAEQAADLIVQSANVVMDSITRELKLRR
ncbi:HK97-gp10 family putative phage morphogenesis protein [Methylomonas sp. CM2]|uniref:HK97-gp10 family putative phage morphogenesis protein n=1 Tax=Methylomonas sp. CM2 TaxID=3417647 RepID=UPI003CEFDEA1